MSEESKFQFDVFLSHNAVDKPIVRELKRRLSSHGLAVWLDEDELRPGMLWQELLEGGIRTCRSVAVLVGKNGVGPWESQEMQSALILAVSTKRPVIPVLLPGALSAPNLPMFLENRTYVQLDADLKDDTIARLIWGITGAKPQPSKKADPLVNLQPGCGIRVRCKLSCRDSYYDSIHTRPMSFIVALCKKFPKTEFRMFKESDPASPANLKLPRDIMAGVFDHGDTLILEVQGEFEIMAATFLKIALENLEGYADNPAATKKRIERLVDEASKRMYDPDLQELEEKVIKAAKEELLTPEDEHRFIAVINDRLHEMSFSMLPMITKHFGCNLQIGFDLPDKGIFSYRMDPANEFTLDKRILNLDVEVGTRITVVTSGAQSDEAGRAVKNFLENLWQCDQWVRRKGKEIYSATAISELLRFAQEIGRTPSSGYQHVQNPFISTLVARRNVFVNAPGVHFSKDMVVRQLAAPHSELHDSDIGEILKGVEKAERKLAVILRPGFALAHTALPHGPRICISFGVYPDGVLWTDTPRNGSPRRDGYLR